MEDMFVWFFFFLRYVLLNTNMRTLPFTQIFPLVGTFTALSDTINVSDGFINPFLYKSGRFHYTLTSYSLITILKFLAAG